MSWSSGFSSSMINKSYWPSTRPDIHPNRRPISAPLAFDPISERNEASFETSFAANGLKSRWNESIFASIHMGRSATLPRAFPI